MKASEAMISETSRGARTAKILGLILYVFASLRLVLFYMPNPALPRVIALLAVFLLLYLLEPWLVRHFPRAVIPYFLFQSVVVFFLAVVRPVFDFTYALYIVLGLQMMPRLPLRRAAWFYLVYSLLACVILYAGMVEWRAEALPRALMIVTIGFFLGWYVQATDQAEQAREHSRRLLLELESAHEQLKQYAGQADQLAAARERDRLARELHDSVNQTVFTINLTAQSIRLFAKKDPAQIPAQLERLRELTGGALAQMRSLITEMRPK